MERKVSETYLRYYNLSAVKRMLTHGFHVSKVKVIPYRKSYFSLMEDKGEYFSVKLEVLRKCIREATMDERKLYALNSDGLTLSYTLIKALEGNKS